MFVLEVGWSDGVGVGVDSSPALPGVTMENSGKSPTLFLENGDFPVEGVHYLKQLEVIEVNSSRYTRGEVWLHSCSALYALPEPRPPSACQSEPSVLLLLFTQPWDFRHVSFMGLANRRKGAGQTYPLACLRVHWPAVCLLCLPWSCPLSSVAISKV